MSGCVLVAALQCHPACVRACVRFHGRYPALAKNWLLDIRRSDNAFELLRPVALHLCALIRNAWLWLLPCDAPSRRAAVFRLFDVDGDGFVTRADLAKSMDLLVGTSISPQTRDEIIRRTIAEADADGDGRISFEDFSQVDASISSLFPLSPLSSICATIHFLAWLASRAFAHLADVAVNHGMAAICGPHQVHVEVGGAGVAESEQLVYEAHRGAARRDALMRARMRCI